MHGGFNQPGRLRQIAVVSPSRHETSSPDKPWKSLILLAAILAASPQLLVQRELHGWPFAALLVCLPLPLPLPLQHGMRRVETAMLLYNVFLSASRMCTSPSYPHSSGVTLHDAIRKIACYDLFNTSTYPVLMLADRGGSGKTVITNRKHPGLETRTTSTRMVAARVDLQP